MPDKLGWRANWGVIAPSTNTSVHMSFRPCVTTFLFFEDCGFEIVALKGLCCPGPAEIAQTTEKEMMDSLKELNESDAEVLVQVGTNLGMARMAAEAEKWLNKPVIAINTATYWYAMRDNNMDDVIDGFGSLMTDYRELPDLYFKKLEEQAKNS